MEKGEAIKVKNKTEMKEIKDYLHLEEWRPIPGFDGYQVSNIGRVRGKRGKLLSQELSSKGYLRTSFTINNKFKSVRVHRLVALAWCPNPENKPTVNHIDTIKINNYEWNLEWATHQEQVVHAIKNKCRKSFALSASTIASVVARSKKPVISYDIHRQTERRFESINECAENIGVGQSAISYAIKRKSLVQNAYKIQYAKET